MMMMITCATNIRLHTTALLSIGSANNSDDDIITLYPSLCTLISYIKRWIDYSSKNIRAKAIDGFIVSSVQLKMEDDNNNNSYSVFLHQAIVLFSINHLVLNLLLELFQGC